MNEELLNKDKRILKLHLIYWAIIFALLAVFLLCVAPGKVNEEAFKNFSFASTIVSIVLAVVSIVYSFRTKSATSDNIAGIREIERSIDGKLDKFDTLEENISKDIQKAIAEGVGMAISELRTDVGNLMDDQADIKQNINRIVSDQKKFFEPDNNASSQTSKREEQTVFKSRMSFVGKVAMYLASLSYSKNKTFSFSDIGEIVNADMDYCWGVFSVLTSCYPDYFGYKFDDSGLFEITKYHSNCLGTVEVWEQSIRSYDDKKIADQYIEAIHAYFGVLESKE